MATRRPAAIHAERPVPARRVAAGCDATDIWHSSKIPDPATKRRGFNFVRFADGEVDAALDRARSGPDCSLAARQREYATFNRILNREQPYYFGFAQTDDRVVSARLRGLTPFVFSSSWDTDLHDVHKWGLAPEKK